MKGVKIALHDTKVGKELTDMINRNHRSIIMLVASRRLNQPGSSLHRHLSVAETTLLRGQRAQCYASDNPRPKDDMGYVTTHMRSGDCQLSNHESGGRTTGSTSQHHDIRLPAPWRQAQPTQQPPDAKVPAWRAPGPAKA